MHFPLLLIQINFRVRFLYLASVRFLFYMKEKIPANAKNKLVGINFIQ